MESFVADLKREVQCSLCRNTLQDPKTLCCFHTFCKKCIEKQARDVGGVAHIFTCPKCSYFQEFNHVDELKASLLHSRILKVLNFVEVEKFCSLSSTCKLVATWFCFDCDVPLCRLCQMNHTKFYKKTQHKCVRLLDLKKEDIKFMLIKPKHCLEHGQINEFFCKDCDRTICTKCFKTFGCYQHDTLPLDLQDSLETLKMAEKVREERIKVKVLNSRVTKLDDILQQVQQDAENSKKKIRKAIELHVAALRKKEKELVKQIDQRMEEMEEIKAREKRVLQQANGRLEHYDKLIERELAGELFRSMKNEIGFSGTFSEVNIEDIKIKSIEFVPNEKLNELIKDTPLGKIESKRSYFIFAKKTETPASLAAQNELKSAVTTSTASKLNNPNNLNIIEPPQAVKNKKKIQEKNVDMGFVPEYSLMPKEINISTRFVMKGLKKQPDRLSGIAVNKDNTRTAIVDYTSHSVNIFNQNGALLKTYGSHGNRENQLSSPRGLAFLDKEELVIADSGNNRICIVNTSTGKLVKSFGSDKAAEKAARLDNPKDVHVDDDSNIVVTDSSYHRVKVFTKNGILSYYFGLRTGECFNPLGVVTHNGHFYVSDRANDVIQVFRKKSLYPEKVSVIGEAGGSENGQLRDPRGLAIDNEHNLLVCDGGNNRIQKFSLDGRFLGKTKDSREFWQINHIAVLKDNRFMVTAGRDGVFIFK